MGWLREFIHDAVDFVVDTAKAVYEFLFVADEANETYSENISETETYTTASTASVRDYAAEATRYMQRVAPLADQMESSCIAVFEKHFKKLMRQASPEKREVYNDKFKENIGTLKGTVKTYMSSRYTADDIEFLPIMEMDRGKEKKRALRKFQDKVQNLAVDELCKQIRIRVENQYAFIKADFDEQFASKKAIYSSTNKQFSILAKKLEDPEYVGKKHDVERLALTGIKCDYILDQLNA